MDPRHVIYKGPRARDYHETGGTINRSVIFTGQGN